jgi:hypothetical protein
MTSAESTTPGDTQHVSHQKPSQSLQAITTLTEQHAIERGWTTTMCDINEEFAIYSNMIYVFHKLDLLDAFDAHVIQKQFETNIWANIRKGTWRSGRTT